MQSAWKACAHSGSARSSSPSVNSSRHTTHSRAAPDSPSTAPALGTAPRAAT
uniref:Uncharacterized protein n=1 Tax=Arundo donax TaxID=35708 RepID=A0A0A9CSC0_ARUDO